ncbi:cell division protein FtsZ, partial [Amycolatopsis rubida]|nr:cell division protein FtsZ [Amycolatopsis rubida]NEC59814.1 cell division protein FtsZ [Amycolatopsis rubida]
PPAGSSGYPVAPPRTPPSGLPQPGTGTPPGGLPQPGGGSRGYSPIGSGSASGGLPSRPTTVHDDPTDDDVDVPPFMRR